MNMTPLEILTKAQELIRDPAHWTRASFARDADGLPTESHRTDAASFCAVGAIRRVMGSDEDHQYKQIIQFLRAGACAQFGREASVIQVNDQMGHAAVMKMFEAARARAARAKAGL